MSRKWKNILIGVLVVILIATSCLTVYCARNNGHAEHKMMMQNNGETPPEMPDGGMEESPAKPEGEGGELNQPPEMPSAPNNNGMMNPPAGNGMQSMNGGNLRSNIPIIYYLLFGAQSLGIALLVMYLIMSGFNKRTFKETLGSIGKITVFVLSSIVITAAITFAESNFVKNTSTPQENNGMMQNGMGQKQENISYSGAEEITEDMEIAGGEYSSHEIDENAILVSGDAEVSIEGVEVEKTGDSDGGDNTSFYGMNSAILAKSGANLTLKNLTITTDATGANGVFSYGGSATTNNTASDGTTVNISDSRITTKKDNSGGIMTTGGGATNAYNLTIHTSGISSAAIRTDRGGGTVTVDGGTYTTTGSGSPAVYSTAEITVRNATLISEVAEGIVIEGKNSVVIENCELTDSNTKLNGLSTTYKNIFLYQSMSGDADTGNSSFTANDSTITTNNGDTFYITNTSSTISLTNNRIVNHDSSGNFLRAKADSWGSEGSNGGLVTLVLANQEAVGNIVIDEISTLDMTMESGSYYEGTINGENSAKSIALTLDETSRIKLTGDSCVTSLNNADVSNSNIDFNGYNLYVNGKAIEE